MMMDGPGAEPPQGTPSRRALGAMESAVRRAREAAGPSSVRPTQPFAEQSPPPPPSTEPAAEPAPLRGHERELVGRRRCRRRNPGRHRSRRPRRVPRERRIAASDAAIHGGHGRRTRRDARCRKTPGINPRASHRKGQLLHRDDDVDHAAGDLPWGTAPDLGAQPSERGGGSGHPGCRSELSELGRTDRGYVQRPGRADELPCPERVHGHRASDGERGVG